MLVLVALPLAQPAVTAPQSVESKRAEAQQVLAQIQELDGELAHVIESYNAAQIELDRIEELQRANERRLRIARSNLGSAQSSLETRLVELYVNGETDLVEILLGSTSLEEILDGLETADRVSTQDAKILAEVQRFRTEIREREAQLAQARERQEEVVAERAAKRDEIRSRLTERERLLSSIRDEIERIQAAERRRQEQLEAQARQRLATETTDEPTAETAPASGGGGGGNAPAPRHGGVVGIAMQYLGIPYQWGGASPSTGFDCSGFVMYVYAQVGVSLPHNAAMQYGYGSPVSRSELAPGDLVFFNGLGHNGIYIGGNQFIHSPHTGDVVKISSLTGWYADTWVGARRL